MSVTYECQHDTRTRVARCVDCERELVLRIQQEARKNTIAALKSYLQHDGRCPTARWCDCGLDEILNAVEEVP